VAVADVVAVFVSGCQLNIPALVSLLRWNFSFLKLDLIQTVLRVCVCIWKWVISLGFSWWYFISCS